MAHYTVTGITSFIGREGHGFNATLKNGGRAVAFVTDAANGGALTFDWLAKHPIDRDNDEAALDAHCKIQAEWTPRDPISGEKGSYPMDRDLFVTQLVETEENRRRFKRLLKGRVLFVVDGVCRRTKAIKVIDAALLAACQTKWPTAQILNGMDFDAAFALYMEHSA